MSHCPHPTTASRGPRTTEELLRDVREGREYECLHCGAKWRQQVDWDGIAERWQRRADKLREREE